MDAPAMAATAHRQARLAGALRNATEVVMAMWPLTSFIAANPARVMERRPFDEAVREIRHRLGGCGLLPPAEYRRLAARGTIDERLLRAAFARRQDAATATVELAGRAIPRRDVQWLGHFELAYRGIDDGELVAAATAAVARWPAPSERPADRRENVDVLARTVDKTAARWLAAYTDGGQATWTMPGRDAGLLAAWRHLVGHQPGLSPAARRRLDELVPTPSTAAGEVLLRALDRLGVEEVRWQPVLEAHLLRLPGWASYLRWRADMAAPGSPEAGFMTDYLALRLAYTAALTGELANVESSDAETRKPSRRRHDAQALALVAQEYGIAAARLREIATAELAAFVGALDELADDVQSLIWLEAHEESYRTRLLAAVARQPHVVADAGVMPPLATRPAVQLVFCIDVRSEPLRRHLESVGPYETFGFAGFFGVPIAYRGFDEAMTRDVCPALLRPRYRIDEAPSPACAHAATAHRDARRRRWQFKKLVSQLKASAAAGFGFVETVGLGFALPFIAKTFAPARFASSARWLARRVAPPAEYRPLLDARGHGEAGSHGLAYGLGGDEKVFFAEAALSVMGLTAGFARVVVLAGHGSRTENNPYGSALDCGACGGHTGGPSARLLAAILNEPDVRRALGERGIVIPGDTWFVAAEHDTTTDEVCLFNRADIPASHDDDLAQLRRDLDLARALNCAERRSRLPLAADGGASAGDHVVRRAVDWAQVRREWGLARNAAFIVGPRWLTAGLDLEGRTFLHSYDWRGDASGKALEIILTAPMVVAEWINTQYYFSTVDNVRFGSGSKVTHNVVGRLGVMQGNAGDLQIGLPEQSVMAAAGELYHEPLRLMTLVLAPPERVLAIVHQNAELRRLFDHAWVALVVLDPTSGRYRRYQPGGRFDEAGAMTPVSAPSKPEPAHAS